MKKKLLLLPLQFFAEPDGAEEAKADEKAEDKAFTQAELDAETSKRVENALKKREATQQKAIADAVAEALKAAEAKAKMTDKERIDAELKAREDALATREAAATRKEFLADVTTELTKEGIPVSFAELIVSSSTRETADDLIKKLKTDWDEALNEQVKGQARQKDAKAPGSALGSIEGLDLTAMALKNRKVR